MANFQGIVLIITVILLIIAIILIAIVLMNSKASAQWPPLIGDCPDYWVDMSGNGAKCINMHDLGSCPKHSGEKHLTMDFTVDPYIGSNGLCSKYQWAQGCGVTWDGISYGYGAVNPCDATTTTEE